MEKGQRVDSFAFAFGRRPSTSSLGDGRCHLVAGRFVKVARNGFAFAVAAVVIGIDEPTPMIQHDEVQRNKWHRRAYSYGLESPRMSQITFVRAMM